MATSSENVQENSAGVREIMLDLPEDEGEGLGFRLTRTLWDPYPWVRDVTTDSRAHCAGLKTGDCLLQADGTDLLGLPVSQVARLIRGDGSSREVQLVVWNCGVDPNEDPELLWSGGGGGGAGERARRALSGAVRALACSVCAATATAPLCCARGHLYCTACWCRLNKCALCREPLPPKESPYAKNLVAEQVFEAIAKEYELKNVNRRPKETLSAYNSPQTSPATHRRGQYQLSLLNRKKVQFNDKYKQTYASDPNLHCENGNSPAEIRKKFENRPNLVENGRHLVENRRPLVESERHLVENRRHLVENPRHLVENPRHLVENRRPLVENQRPLVESERHLVENQTQVVENTPIGNSIENGGKCNCQCENLDKTGQNREKPLFNNGFNVLEHKLVTRVRQACSMADLQNALQNSHLSKSLNNLVESKETDRHISLDNLKVQSSSNCDLPVLLLTTPPIYLVTCEHNKQDI